MKIKDLIIVSDLDGTVVPISGIISDKNIEAIRKFRSFGGTFTIATGRSPTSAKEHVKKLEIDGAFICNNGTQIFDAAQNKSVWNSQLPESYKRAVVDLTQQFDSIGVELITDCDETYIVKINDMYGGDDPRFKHCSLETAPHNLCKVAMWDKEENIIAAEKYITARGYNELEFVKSGAEWFEIMEAGVDKGFPLEKLTAYYKKTMDGCFAIGDFFNDIGMIKRAGIGVAVQNAADEVKEAATITVAACEEDAIADLIDYIFKNYEI